jgi:hypothetical protein
MQCAIIMVTDQLPDAAAIPKKLLREIFFVKKPFYVPVFFKELYQLARQKENLRQSGTFPDEAVILKKITG